MILDEDTPGVDTIDFDIDNGRVADEATISCRKSIWEAPPGSVVIIQNSGPADGRWLVTTIRRENIFSSASEIDLRRGNALQKEKKIQTRDSSPNGKYPKGVGSFEGVRVAEWIVQWLEYGRAHGWSGRVTSGYRTYADQKRIYDSGVRPAAKPGTSNHEQADFPGGAVDVTEAEQLSKILKAAHAPLEWAGSKDPVHFSHPHGGSY